MVLIILLIILISATAYAQYATQHFIIHANDSVLAGYLEEAYSYYIKRGLTPMPPCEGNRYPVYINDTMQFAGRVTSRYTGDKDRISRCIVKIEFRSEYTRNKGAVFHEVGHVFFPFEDYFWAVEAVVEAMEAVGADNYCNPSQYFFKKLYQKNPFSYVNWSREWYYYSAAFVWYLQRWDDWKPILRAADRQEAARLYVQFLLGLVRGVRLGGAYVIPAMRELNIDTSRDLWIDGYSAAYFKVNLPAKGLVRIDAPRLISNLRLGEEFYVDNGTLLIALVNNSTEPVSTKVTIRFKSLRVEPIGGAYYKGLISFKLYAEEGGKPVNGVVKINDTEVLFSNGIGFYNFSGELRPYVLNYKGMYIQLIPLEIDVYPTGED